MYRFNLYQEGNSVLHRLDPRVKMVWTVWVFAMVLVFNNPLYLAGVFVLVLAALIVSRASAKRILGSVLVLIPVLLGTIILWPLFINSGTEIFALGPIQVTNEGVLFALAIGLRIITPVLAAILLFLTTKRRDIVTGLVRLGIPYKIGFAITIAFGFIPTLVGIGETILEAQRARALDLERGSIFARLRKYTSIIVPLMISAIGSIQNLAFSMDARAFGAEPRRAYLHQLALSGLGWTLLIVAVITLVVAIVLRLNGYGAVLPGRI